MYTQTQLSEQSSLLILSLSKARNTHTSEYCMELLIRNNMQFKAPIRLLTYFPSPFHFISYRIFFVEMRYNQKSDAQEQSFFCFSIAKRFLPFFVTHQDKSFYSLIPPLLQKVQQYTNLFVSSKTSLFRLCVLCSNKLHTRVIFSPSHQKPYSRPVVHKKHS